MVTSTMDDSLQFRSVRFALFVVGSLLAACSSVSPSAGTSITTSSSTSTSGSGSGGGSVVMLPEPLVHRAEALSCEGAPPKGNAAPTETTRDCTEDADCTMGDNGRCVWPYAGDNLCVYDECFEDSDCGSAQVCGCRVENNFGVNVCYHGNCQLDADCGAGGYCSPSGQVSPTCGDGVAAGSIGYFCHTADDECTDDADCEGESNICLFQVEAAHWVCQQLLCLG